HSAPTRTKESCPPPCPETDRPGHGGGEFTGDSGCGKLAEMVSGKRSVKFHYRKPFSDPVSPESVLRGKRQPDGAIYLLFSHRSYGILLWGSNRSLGWQTKQ